MLIRFVISTRGQVNERIQLLYGIAPEPPRGARETNGMAAAAGKAPTVPVTLGVEGPLAPFGFGVARAAELDSALRTESGVFLVTGTHGPQLEEMYLRIWRYAQELDRGDRPACEGIGEVRDSRSAERLFRPRTASGLRLGFVAGDHAASALQRLVDLGVHPDRLQGLITGVLTVAVVRGVCAQCAEAYDPHTLVLNEWFGAGASIETARWRRGRGCVACNGTGFAGEIVLDELWLPNAHERQQVAQRAPMRTLRASMLERIESLGRGALRRAMVGETTLEELLKRLPVDEVRAVRQTQLKLRRPDTRLGLRHDDEGELRRAA
jgi:hypothetical protein